MGEFGCACIPLEIVADRYLGLPRREALTRAAHAVIMSIETLTFCRVGTDI